MSWIAFWRLQGTSKRVEWQDNDLPSLLKSDKAKDIPNFLQAARAFCARSGVF
jgi:hypothetical protein